MAIRIFISYASEDRAIAKQLYEALSAFDDVQVWLDVHSLLPGETWQEAITTAIEESDAIILLLSNASINKTGYVQREVREALDRLSLLPPGDRLVMPVRISECTPRHRELNKLHRVDLFPTWEPGFSQLLAGLGLRSSDSRRSFTHKYFVIAGRSFILPVEKEIPPEQHEKLEVEPILVSFDGLPRFSSELVYREGLVRSGSALNIFLTAWDTAVEWDPYYPRYDWRKLDWSVFTPTRAVDDTILIASMFTRLWPAARQLAGYREQNWSALYKLLFAPNAIEAAPPATRTTEHTARFSEQWT